MRIFEYFQKCFAATMGAEFVFFCVIFAAVSCPGQATARSLEIYVNNQPFYGRYLVRGDEIFVERQAASEALHYQNGVLFPQSAVIEQNGLTYVSLSEIARIIHAEYRVNWETGIADLYLPARVAAFPAWPSGNKGPVIITIPYPEKSSGEEAYAESPGYNGGSRPQPGFGPYGMSPYSAYPIVVYYPYFPIRYRPFLIRYPVDIASSAFSGTMAGVSQVSVGHHFLGNDLIPQHFLSP